MANSVEAVPFDLAVREVFIVVRGKVDPVRLQLIDRRR
jgi:hypothetical protein